MCVCVYLCVFKPDVGCLCDWNLSKQEVVCSTLMSVACEVGVYRCNVFLQVFPRIYNPLKDWVTADEAYARKLQDEANDILRRKVQVTEDTRRSMIRADDMRSKVRLFDRLAG